MWYIIKGSLHLLISLPYGNVLVTLSLTLATFCRPSSLSHSILFSITCTFRHRRECHEQDALVVVNHHCQGCHTKRASIPSISEAQVTYVQVQLTIKGRLTLIFQHHFVWLAIKGGWQSNKYCRHVSCYMLLQSCVIVTCSSHHFVFWSFLVKHLLDDKPYTHIHLWNARCLFRK